VREDWVDDKPRHLAVEGKRFRRELPGWEFGRITMQHIPGHVVFEREDHSGALSGLTVTYYGELRTDQITHGTLVQWMAGKSTSVTFTATLVYQPKRK
jgi:hypothetical protein